MKKFSFNERQRKIAAGTVFVLFLAALGVCTYFLWEPISRLSENPEQFREWIDHHYWAGRLVFLAVMILQVFIAFIPGEPLEIFAGYAFGTLGGTILCLAGGVIGSVIVFLFVRRFGMKLVRVFFSEEKIRSLTFLQTNRQREILFFFIFMIPGTPKDLLCYFAALTDMRLSAWLIICSVGRIPALITSTIGGDALGVQNYTFAIAVFAVTLAVSGIGLLIYRLICRRAERK